MNWKYKKLKKGETFITSEKGNSMSPIIQSRQKHKLAPIELKDVKVGDVVFCKVKGYYYTHFVKAKNDKRGCLIGNNRGGINGWTKQIYGKVIEILN